MVASTVSQLKECLSKELPKLEKNMASNTPLSEKFYERCLDTLQRLDELPIDLSVLSKTLVGTVVSKYKSCPDPSVAAAAKKLVKKWKKLAKEEGMATKPATVPSTKPAPAKRTSSTSSQVRKATQAQASAGASCDKFNHLAPIRKAICNKFYALFLGSTSDTRVVADRAAAVEDAIELKHNGGSQQYKDKARSLIFNIKKNDALRDNIVSGAIEPKVLVTMTSDQLATSEKAAARNKMEADLADSRRLDWETANEDKINEMCGIKGDLLSASLFTCGRCKSVKTTSTQKQTRSADEPMTVFVLCLNCGCRWKC